jgi:hypothetical protein
MKRSSGEKAPVASRARPQSGRGENCRNGSPASPARSVSRSALGASNCTSRRPCGAMKWVETFVQPRSGPHLHQIPVDATKSARPELPSHARRNPHLAPAEFGLPGTAIPPRGPSVTSCLTSVLYSCCRRREASDEAPQCPALNLGFATPRMYLPRSRDGRMRPSPKGHLRAWCLGRARMAGMEATHLRRHSELERGRGALRGGLTALFASGSHQLTPPASLPGTPALQAWARPLASSTKVPRWLPAP